MGRSIETGRGTLFTGRPGSAQVPGEYNFPAPGEKGNLSLREITRMGIEAAKKGVGVPESSVSTEEKVDDSLEQPR
jgi:hypothetical protein